MVNYDYSKVDRDNWPTGGVLASSLQSQAEWQVHVGIPHLISDEDVQQFRRRLAEYYIVRNWGLCNIHLEHPEYFKGLKTNGKFLTEGEWRKFLAETLNFEARRALKILDKDSAEQERNLPDKFKDGRGPLD